MDRLDIGEGNYIKELEEDYEIADQISELQEIVFENESKCEKFKDQFLHYSYLWTQDLSQSLHQFLEQNAEILEDGSKDDPSLEKFEAEISKYKKIEKEIEALPTSGNIGWIQVDAKPLKHSLSSWASKWVYLFTHYLEDKVINSMTELYQFMQSGNEILDKQARLRPPR